MYCINVVRPNRGVIVSSEARDVRSGRSALNIFLFFLGATSGGTFGLACGSFLMGSGGGLALMLIGFAVGGYFGTVAAEALAQAIGSSLVVDEAHVVSSASATQADQS